MDANIETWPWGSRLLAHGQACAALAQELKAALPATADIFDSIGTYLDIPLNMRPPNRPTSAPWQSESRYTSPITLNLALYANNLGYVLRALGDSAGAKAKFERALVIWEKVSGPNHPQVATAVNNLGRVLQDLGDLEGAKAHCERALAIDEAVYGPDHPNVAIRVNNLGCVLQELGDLAEARAHYERALAIDEAAYGPDHPGVARDVNNLGSALRALGDLAGAKVYYERALAIDEAAYGPDHPNVATDVNNLGSVLQDQETWPGPRALTSGPWPSTRPPMGRIIPVWPGT